VVFDHRQSLAAALVFAGRDFGVGGCLLFSRLVWT
jgi:hypothetical protein